jgi:hypothetical protein
LSYLADAVWLGPGAVFGFKTPLQIFGLLKVTPQTDPNPVRHTLGFDFPALARKKNPLHFFCLLPRFGSLRVPHNRQVEDGRPLPFKSFWAHHLS